MKQLSFLAGAVLLSTLTSVAQLAQTSRLNDPAPAGLTVTSRPVDTRLVDNLLGAYEAGDSYTGAKGRRPLLRLSGAVAVQVTSGAALEALTVKGGALEGYERGVVSKGGFAWLMGGAEERDLQIKNRALLASRIDATRKAENVRTANPVFIEPESGLWAMTTDEIIIALKPGVEARAYFGGEWARVKPLFIPLSQYILTLPSSESEAVFAEVTRRATDARVAWAEPNFISQGLTQLIPNDPQFANQWHLQNSGQTGGSSGADIKATTAWDRTTGTNSIIVAVMDIGFDLAHPDLIANIATNASEIPGNSVDDDGNGYVDDVRGWDFFASDNNPSPNTEFDNHGTPVAGAAVASGNNGAGIAGMAYGCRFLPLRIGEATTAGSFSSRDSDLANALYYAAGGFSQADTWRGADVIVMSFESFQAAVMDSALTYAAEQGRGGRGCPLFVAMGNHGDNWRTLSLNNIPPGTYGFEWKYTKNSSGVDGEDAAWLAQVTFPGGAVERFDGGVFPPAGWTTAGNANWTRATDPAHAYGSSLFTARSGVIGHNQSSSLMTTRAVSAGSLLFVHWVSSEAGADVLSLSINGTVQTSANQSGAPFIRSGPSYPGTHTNVITVGASTHWDTRASYSQIGGKIDFLAPGGGGGGALIVTTDRLGTNGDNSAPSPDGDYQLTLGTSLANPIAAGVGALMLSVTPTLSASKVRDILRMTADKVGPVPYTNGWNSYYGAGRVNASNAVALAWAPNCLGVPIVVRSLADSGPGTLREAMQQVEASGCPGVISLAVTGVINLALPLPPMFNGGASFIGPGTNHLTINGGGTNFLFRFGINTTNRLSGLRLVNAAFASPGASVWSRGWTVIENCVFSNSVSLGAAGGAVANIAGDPGDVTGIAALFITNCTFIGNSARGGAGEDRGAGRNGGPGGGGAGLGGAVFHDGTELVLHGCAFVRNTAAGGNGGNGDGNSFSNDTGGNGGPPNRGNGGGIGQPGGTGGFGGGGGGGAGSSTAGFAGGAGGFGGGGGGGGARGGGGSGGAGGDAGLYGGAGGGAFSSRSGGGGGGAGLGGAVFTRTGSGKMINCSFTGNNATNGVGGAGSFGGGNGGIGQGAGGAVFNLDAAITAQNLSFNGNSATTGSPNVEASILVTTLADDGPGSLRRAIGNAALRPTTDAITFATNLSGGVIRLTSSELLISNLSAPLIISAGSLAGGLAISGENMRRAFHVTFGSSLTLHSVTLSNCFCGGAAGTDGGAVWSGGDLNLFRSALVNNSAPNGEGGALKSAAGTLMVDGCTFLANGAKTSGGALSSVANSTVRNSTFVRNIATNDYGGAVYATQMATVQHCTIVSNSAGQTGGGVLFAASPGQRVLSHCIVTGNTAAKAPEVSLNGASAFFNAVGFSDGLTNGVNGNLVGRTNAPIDPLLDSLKFYGGPTLTMHPLPGSPVIDKGDPAFSGAGLTDQRGWPRVSFGRVDIGAVEYAPVAGNSIVFDGVNDFLILSNAGLSLPTNEITVEFWERVETVRDQFSFILFPDVPADRLAFSSVRLNLATYWDFGDLFNGGRLVYGTPSGTIHQWTHWALVSTRAGNAMRVYRNGALDAVTATNRALVRYAAALVLGARLDVGGQEFFKGEIDEFRVWSVARTPFEIQAGMKTGVCPPQTNLWLYWKFNEPSGVIVFDQSGNGRDGLLFNGATRTVSFAPLLAPGAASVVRLTPTQVRVTWMPDVGCLESAPEVTGPWSGVPGATNGQVIVTTPARQFFRVTQ